MKAQKEPVLERKEVVQRVENYAIPQHKITILYNRKKPESLLHCNMTNHKELVPHFIGQ
jgi:hypothetical protein